MFCKAQFMNYTLMEKYDRFGDIGFSAGIFLKGPWEKQGDIYNKLKSKTEPAGKKIVAPIQMHGSKITILDDSRKNERITADGVVSKNGGYCLTVKTADCVPLVLADPRTGFFGAVHIGWRGLAGGILENLSLAIKNLDINFNRLYISLGPSIGSCCFEVGGEVAVLFDDSSVTIKDDRYFLDIKGLIKERLISFGVSENRISEAAECTSCHTDRYYSFRRDGRADIQMVSFISRT